MGRRPFLETRRISGAGVPKGRIRIGHADAGVPQLGDEIEFGEIAPGATTVVPVAVRHENDEVLTAVTRVVIGDVPRKVVGRVAVAEREWRAPDSEEASDCPFNCALVRRDRNVVFVDRTSEEVGPALNVR